MSSPPQRALVLWLTVSQISGDGRSLIRQATPLCHSCLLLVIGYLHSEQLTKLMEESKILEVEVRS